MLDLPILGKLGQIKMEGGISRVGMFYTIAI